MGSSYEIDRVRGEIAAAHQALTAAGVPKGHDDEPLTLPGRIGVLAKMTGDLIAEVGRLRAGVAAGPQATPQVLWEGWAGTLGRELHNQGTWKVLDVAPSRVIRVVAAPTSQENQT